MTVRDTRSISAERGRGARSDDRGSSEAGDANAAARELAGAHAMPRTRPVRPRRSGMSRPTSSVPRPTRSGRRRRLRPKTRRQNAGHLECLWQRAELPVEIGIWCSTTSGCATSSAGSSSIAKPVRDRSPTLHRQVAITLGLSNFSIE